MKPGWGDALLEVAAGSPGQRVGRLCVTWMTSHTWCPADSASGRFPASVRAYSRGAPAPWPSLCLMIGGRAGAISAWFCLK